MFCTIFFCMKLINLLFAFTSGSSSATFRGSKMRGNPPHKSKRKADHHTSLYSGKTSNQNHICFNDIAEIFMAEFSPSKYSGKCSSLSIGNAIKQDCSG